MINRRLLRTKALQVLYAYYLSDQPALAKSEKELLFSIDKTYEMYYLFLLLFLELADYADSRIEIAKSKYFPTQQESNPNIRFVENPIITALRENSEFQNYIAKNKTSWANHPELTRNIYNKLSDYTPFANYMEKEEVNFQDHKDILEAIFTDLIFPNELVHQILEERSIYWNDDLEFAGTMTLKTLDHIKENGQIRFLPKYKNQEDEQFVKELFRKTVINAVEMRELIERYAKNWEFERIALMDVFIMQMALTEAIEFPSIPTKVTFNEYIEIAKYYSTEKSSTFINGILDKAFVDLKNEKKITKTGRGLIGEM